MVYQLVTVASHSITHDFCYSFLKEKMIKSSHIFDSVQVVSRNEIQMFQYSKVFAFLIKKKVKRCQRLWTLAKQLKLSRQKKKNLDHFVYKRKKSLINHFDQLYLISLTVIWASINRLFRSPWSHIKLFQKYINQVIKDITLFSWELSNFFKLLFSVLTASDLIQSA